MRQISQIFDNFDWAHTRLQNEREGEVRLWAAARHARSERRFQ